MTTTPIEMSIEGMTCGHCAMTVRKALRATPGVADVQVDVAEGRAHVTPAAAAPDVQALRNAVEDAGYTVTAVN